MREICWLLLLLGTLNFSGLAQTGRLKGRVTVGGEPLGFSSVVLSGTGLGVSTDGKGYYEIRNILPGSYVLVATHVGCQPQKIAVVIKKNVAALVNIDLKIDSTSIGDVVVTALGIQTTLRRAPVPVTVVSHDAFIQQASTNVIDAIARQPGITAITTGPGVSKPEINGLGYNRVLTLMDGERQEDFQWGDEHGILIDPYAVYNAEIIRGAASLQYGANAMAGVVSFKSQPARADGVVDGSLTSEYQANNGLIGNSLAIGGNGNGLAWDARGSYEEAHSYWDPHDGYVWGTAFRQYNVRASLGINRDWGYSRLILSTLHRRIEIPDGNRDSATGQFEFDVPIGAQFKNGEYLPGTGQIFPDRGNFFSYDPDISSYQVLDHDEIWWQNSIRLAGGSIGADIGFTESIRHEIDTGNIAEENMFVHDVPYSLKYQLERRSGLKLTAGVNGMYEFMNNGPEPPSPYIGDFEIPDYHLFDAGGYGILEKEFKQLTLSGGWRYDLRSIAGRPLYLANFFTPEQEEVPAGTPGAYQQFSPFRKAYTGFSGSLGATYQLPQHNYVKLNVAKSYRAPAINELTSNELNPGAFAFELGNTGLKAESGYEWDAAFGNNGRDFSMEIDGFYNYINNFIFSDRLGSKNGGDSLIEGKPAYQYTANTAIITGATAYFNIHPDGAKWFEWENGFTYVYNFLPGKTDSTRHIPWTPAPRLTSEVTLKLNDKAISTLSGAYLKFGLEHDWAQRNIYSAFYTELPSYAYTLINAGIGTKLINRKNKHVLCSIFITCTNLMNIAYVDHTARTQYFWAYNGANDPTNFGRTPAVVTRQSEGIFNMGRNVGLKLLVPFGISGANSR